MEVFGGTGGAVTGLYWLPISRLPSAAEMADAEDKLSSTVESLAAIWMGISSNPEGFTTQSAAAAANISGICCVLLAGHVCYNRRTLTVMKHSSMSCAVLRETSRSATSAAAASICKSSNSSTSTNRQYCCCSCSTAFSAQSEHQICIFQFFRHFSIFSGSLFNHFLSFYSWFLFFLFL